MNIAIDALTFTYDSEPLLQNLALHIRSGEIVAIIGASGCGKTTLLRLLAKDMPSSAISLQGPASLMTQEDLLLPWKTVLDNAILGQAISSPHEVDKDHAAALLTELGLGDVLNAFPDTLSVGMRQRVSLARALLNGSRLLLLDEPFSALDVGTRHQLYQVLRRIHAEIGMTTVLATHDFSDALALADRILLLAEGCVAKAWDIPADCRTVPAERLKWQEALKKAFFLQINSKNS